MKTTFTVRVVIDAPIEKVWECWTSPTDIKQWNNASADWHTTHAVNDLHPGGHFSYRMEAKDGSMGFDFSGVYTLVNSLKQIDYTMDDGRKASVSFSRIQEHTEVVEIVEAEDENPIEMQYSGWQQILDNFKTYTELHK